MLFRSIVFATGEQNAGLYDLSKQVGKIEATEYAGGTTLNIYGKDGKYLKGEHFNGATDPKIEEFVGKEMAQKIADSKGKGEWSGLDLQVGGEGMKAFYDKKVPNILNSIGKKYGVKTQLYGHAIETQKANKYQNDAMAEAIELTPAQHALVHHFPITEEMRQDVLQNGLPLYAEGGEVHSEDDPESCFFPKSKE